MNFCIKFMRIMWLYSHLTIPAGGTRYVFETVKRLSESNEVYVFVQKANPIILEQFEKNSINVVTLGKYSTDDFLFWINFKKIINKQTNYLKNESKNFDVVVSSMFPMNLIANELALPHLQNCFQPYAFFWDSIMIKKFPFFKRIFIKICKHKFGRLDIQATKNSNVLFTVIAGIQNWITKIYSRDSIVVPAGVDTDFFCKTYDKKLAKKYKNYKIILHSTDWTPLKNTNWLLKEFPKIKEKVPNSKLLILEVKTSGFQKEEALKLIKKNSIDNVELCGFVPENLLPSYYSLADVVVYPGIGEGASSASYVVLESLATETPVVRTDESSDEVIHGETGYLFRKNDSKSFCKYVIELLTNNELANKFGNNGRKFVKKNRSWDFTIQQYQKHLDKIFLNK